MVVHLGMDNSGFARKLTESSNSLKSFKRSIGLMEKQLNTNNALIKYANGGAAAFKAYGAKANTLNGLIQQQSLFQAKLANDFERSKTATGALTDQSYRLAAQYQDGQTKLATYRGELAQTVREQYSQYGLTARLGQGLTKISQGLGRVSSATRGMTTALGAGFVQATRSAVSFENGMKTIQALISDDIPANKMTSTMDQLSNAVKKYATEYGISTGDVIEGMTEMIRRGYDVNQTMAAMPHVLEASKASGEGFGTVMHATTAILEQFNLKAEDTQRVTDSLTFVANKTASDFSSLGVAMEYVGPMAATAGISLEETASAIGLLSQRGIEGEKAGTNLRNILTALVKPTKSQAVAFEKMGISLEEFRAGNLSLADVLDLARVNTEGLTGAQKAALYSQAVGKTGQAGFNALIAQGGDALRRLTQETNNAKGATKRMSDQMMESSENQLKKAQAELEVLGIEIGSKLLPNINNLLKEGVKVIDWFKDLSPATQDMILKFALGAAAISPFTGALSLLTGVTGKTLSGIASMAGKVKSIKALLNVSREATGAAQGIALLGESATGATGAVGDLAGKAGLLGALFTPTGALVAGGVLAAAVIGYFAQKAIDARKRAEEWGTAVNSTQAVELQGFKNKVDETNHAMTEFGSGAVKDIENVRKAFKGLTDEITKLADKDLAKKVKLAEKLGISQETINTLTNQTEQVKNNVQQMSDEVINIYKNASEQHRQLTAEEKAVVLANQNELIKTQLSLMKYSSNEKIAITKAMNGQLDELNDSQISKAKKVVEGWIKDENKAYKERKSNLQKLYDDIRGEDEAALKAREEIRTKMQTLEAEHNAKMDAYGEKWVKIQQKLTETALSKSTSEAQKAILDQMKRNANELGLSYDELVNKFSNASSKIQEESELWAKTTEKTTAAGKLANTQWNAMVWDSKTGKVKTNAQEEIQKALQAEGGWEAMKFVVKEANLKTNAKIAIGEALVATGQWNNLKPEDKKLITDGKPAIEAILNSKEMLEVWNAMPEQVKKILGDSENFLNSAEVAQHALDAWNLMTPTQQKLMVEDLASGNIETVRRAVETLTGKTLPIEATNNTALPAQEAQNTIDAVRQYQSVYINAKNNTQGEANAASAAINSVKQNKAADINATDVTGGAVTSAKWQLSTVPGQTFTTITAIDNASGVISGIASKLASVTGNFIANVAAGRYARGTDHHPGGLAVVNDEGGPNYRELVTLPNGLSFIPKGRNVLFPLPKGSKVLRASMTKRLFPQYKDGVGYSKDSPLFKQMDAVQSVIIQSNQSSASAKQSDTSQVVSEIAILRDSLTELLEKILKKDNNVYLNGERMGQKLTDIQSDQEKLQQMLKGKFI
ncbi:phage tail tape measure protein [Streptococcus sp. HF-2466]|uniref:phage tail tape measure protein n=1 Tax=Streptococcus sp. HF-2466 TaxID=2785792 RepID=UPI00189EE799|nr:phage tail tape measure protein [Streptococcus sp. HF-2466]MBF7050575.1 phage tail tape measure protein [Streptococcus sp. HF-2466]